MHLFIFTFLLLSLTGGVRFGNGHLIDGIFTEPTLEPGYNLVAVVPRGALALNVTELRHTQNYLALATVGAQVVPQNAHCVVYTDSCGQLLDTLPVCQDFNRQVCNRPACKFIHLSDGNVEVIENRVTVCRDAVKGACMRPQCKYYHIPIALPPAPLMAIASSASP